MNKKALILAFILFALPIITIFPVNAVTKEYYSHTITWVAPMEFENEWETDRIWYAKGGYRMGDYEGTLGTGELEAIQCILVYNKVTSKGILLCTKVRITISGGIYDGGTIEGIHIAKMGENYETAGKTTYRRGTGPLEGIKIRVTTEGIGDVVNAEGTIMFP